MAVQRILGIDPGSIITGWGVVEGDHQRLTHIDNGGIFTRNKEFHCRLREIHDGLQKVIYEYRPTHVALEQVFMSKNAQSALKLGQARGVALIVALNANLQVSEFMPTSIKLAVVGHGRASKDQVASMVQTILGLPEPAQVDASDALAAALTYLLQPKINNALLAAQPPKKRSSRGSRRRRRASSSA